MEVTQRIRANLLGVTAFLSLISLALVFAAVLEYVPESLLPRVDPLVTAIPHINVLLSLGAIVSILTGVRAIKNGNIERHRLAMLVSTALFAGFLVLYLYRVSLEGPGEFPGPDTVRQFVYLPVLAIHILLAILCIPFVYHALLLAGTHRVSELPNTSHARVGKIAATLWVISFTLGISIYLLLYVLF